LVLDAQEVWTLAEACAPDAAAETLLAIAEVESGRQPLAIGVNRPARASLRFASREAAVEEARWRLARGEDLDLGLMQINGRNLAWLGLALGDAFDPCRSLEAAGRLLADAYDKALGRGLDPAAALDAALSTYNTGHPSKGLRNGYVARVRAASPSPAPAPAQSPDVFTARLGQALLVFAGDPP